MQNTRNKVVRHNEKTEVKTTDQYQGFKEAELGFDSQVQAEKKPEKQKTLKVKKLPRPMIKTRHYTAPKRYSKVIEA